MGLIEAAAFRVGTQYGPGTHRLHIAVERELARRCVDEARSGELPGSICNQHGLGFGARLQSRCQIWRLADGCRFLRSPRTDPVAHHDYASRDADAYRHPLAGRIEWRLQ